MSYDFQLKKVMWKRRLHYHFYLNEPIFHNFILLKKTIVYTHLEALPRTVMTLKIGSHPLSSYARKIWGKYHETLRNISNLVYTWKINWPCPNWAEKETVSKRKQGGQTVVKQKTAGHFFLLLFIIFPFNSEGSISRVLSCGNTEKIGFTKIAESQFWLPWDLTVVKERLCTREVQGAGRLTISRANGAERWWQQT